MRTVVVVLALATSLPSTACAPPRAAPTAPAPSADDSRPLYVPARPADLDAVLHRDAAAPEAGADAAAAPDAASIEPSDHP